MKKEKVLSDKIVTNIGKGVVALAKRSAELSANSACSLGFYEYEQPEEEAKLKKIRNDLKK